MAIDRSDDGQLYEYIRPDGTKQRVRCAAWSVRGGALCFLNDEEDVVLTIAERFWAAVRIVREDGGRAIERDGG